MPAETQSLESNVENLSDRTSFLLISLVSGLLVKEARGSIISVPPSTQLEGL